MHEALLVLLLMNIVTAVQENLDPDCKKLLRFACMQSDLLKTYSRILQIPLHNPEISKNGDHFAQVAMFSENISSTKL